MNRARCGEPEIHPATGLTIAQTRVLENIGRGRLIHAGFDGRHGAAGVHTVLEALLTRGLIDGERSLTAKGRALFEKLAATEPEPQPKPEQRPATRLLGGG